MPNAKIKVNFEDEYLASRSVSLSLRNKSIEAPRRALHLSSQTDSESRMIASKNVRGLNELYRIITKDTLTKINGDKDKQEEFVSGMFNVVKKINNNDEITFMIFSFENGGTKPTDHQAEYLCDLLSAPFNDIIVPPIIPSLSGQQYLEFLETFFSYLQSVKQKTVMGLIPYISRLEISPILDFYTKNEINMLAIDFNGKHPLKLYPTIRKITRALSTAEKEYRQNFYLHGINVSFGRALPQDDAAPAKDILAFMMGFDSFGSSHIRRKMDPSILEKLKKQKKIEKKYVRLFNRKDYGYYKSDLSRIEDIIPSERNVSLEVKDLDYDAKVGMVKLNRLQKVFNAERHGIEADNLHTALRDNRLKKYIESKSQVKQEIEIVAKLKSRS